MIKDFGIQRLQINKMINLLVQICWYIVGTNLLVHFAFVGTKMGVFVKYLTDFVIYRKLFDRFVGTKIQQNVVKTGIFRSKMGFLG